MKKAVLMLLLVIISLSVVLSVSAEDFHIAIVTGTVSQSEDDRRCAEAVQAKYGEDMVKLATYPDNFGEELETTIQTIVNTGMVTVV